MDQNRFENLKKYVKDTLQQEKEFEVSCIYRLYSKNK